MTWKWQRWQRLAIRVCGPESALVHSLNSPDLGDVGFEVALNAHAEGEVAGGAVDARAVEADEHDAVRSHVDEFEVAAVGLDGRPDQRENTLDALVERVGGLGGGH